MAKKGGKLDNLKDTLKPILAPLEALGIFGFFFVTLLPLVIIIIKAKQIGKLWIVIALLYLALFITANGLLIRRKHLNHLHFVMGDELFYREYPKEKERDMRKKEKTKAYFEKLERKRSEKSNDEKR